MRTKRKAEEKKMNMSKNIARLAVTAGLTAALSFGGVMAPVTMAFADDAVTAPANSITINQAKDNESTTFKAYQIFKATVTDTESGKTAQNITWASSELGEKVTKAIKNDWAGYKSLTPDKQLPETPTAQEVADFLMAHAGSTSAGTESTKGTRIATDNILYAVANAIKNEMPVKSNIAAGTAWAPDAENGSGYYLFVTNALSDSSKKVTGTAPIFAVVGGNAVTVTEKTSIPTVDKQILASAPDNPTTATGWAGVADSQIGQEVTYKLTGKVADNYDTYDSYAYKFTDTLSKGLTYTDNSVEVYAVNKDSSNQDKYEQIANTNYTTNTTDNADGTTTLTIEFGAEGEKKGLKDISNVNADTQIVVFYNAKLNKNAVTGNGTGDGKKGNYNTVKLEYSNNPYTEGTGTSVEGGAGDFTFQLNINKVDQGTEKGLEGAVFTIKSNNKYVASKDGDGFVAGELVDVADANNLPEHVKFTSKADGTIAAKGLDAGTYTVTEIKTSDKGNYTAADPFTFTISAEYENDAVKTLAVSPANSDERRSDVVLGTLDETPGDNKLTVKDGTAANPTTGEVTITIGNTKQVGLPLTGLNGVTFTWIAGGAVLCIGVAHLIRSRKQAEESEQE